MKNLIVANWKLNPISKQEADVILDGVKKGISGLNSEVVICPPFIYLAELGGLTLGAQNMCYEDKGAFTGEISCVMLNNIGVKYVIIGHSERRKYFGETDEIVNKKIKKALEIGLKVIFCIGETAEERDAGKKNEVLEKQINRGLDGISNLENINIAYEPVWAIGTGNNCGVEETKESINYIRKLVKPDTRILYGGSVKSENSGAYIKEAGANGLLVGGASLNPEEFVKIVKSAQL
jgi:triosephosphate isomerase